MNILLETFEKKEPLYQKNYQKLIDRLTRKGKVDISSGTDDERFDRGKVFGAYYECYMYAFIVGVRSNNRLSFERKNGNKFYPLGSWKPEETRRYIFSCLLAISNISFVQLEDLSYEKANEYANTLVNLLEEYTNGGFEIIEKQILDNASYFETPFNIIALLKDLKPV